MYTSPHTGPSHSRLACFRVLVEASHLGRSSYTVTGPPERPRPGPRTANPSLAARRRDGSFSLPPTTAVMLSMSVRLQRSSMAACIASVATPSFRRSLDTHQPASTSSGSIPSMPSTGKAQFGATEEALVPPVPDRPGAEAVLLPLHLGGAGVTQCVGGVPRRSCVLGLVEPCSTGSGSAALFGERSRLPPAPTGRSYHVLAPPQYRLVRSR